MSSYRDPSMLGVSGHDRRDADFYETPAWCVAALLEHVDPGFDVWEPACGRGAIVRALKPNPDARFVFATDLHKFPAAFSACDFLETDHALIEGSIITNPPYKLAEKFVRHALELSKPYNGMVAMLLRNEWDSAASRVDLFEAPSFRMKIVLNKRPRWIEGTKGSPRHNYAWFVWMHGNKRVPCLKYGPTHAAGD